METAKIKTSTIAQAEIQRRHRAQRMETAKIKLLLKLKYREGVEHKGWKQQRLRLVLLQGRDHSAVCKTM